MHHSVPHGKAFAGLNGIGRAHQAWLTFGVSERIFGLMEVSSSGSCKLAGRGAWGGDYRLLSATGSAELPSTSATASTGSPLMRAAALAAQHHRH